MNKLTAAYITTEQNFEDETTNYWFLVDGASYALSDCNGALTLLDCDGVPVDESKDSENIKQLLIDADPCAFS